MEEKIKMEAITLLQQSPIFFQADAALLREAVQGDGCALRFASKGEILLCANSGAQQLGMLVQGSARVEKISGGHRVFMSRLTAGNLFGAITLYQQRGYFVTEITALEPCMVLTLNREAVGTLLRRDIRIAEQYIAYLSERIYFLNSRIDAFTGGSAERRLSGYLAAQCPRTGEQRIAVGSYKRLAELLDIGRASLYRALDVLTQAELISREGKQIVVIDREKLQRFCADPPSESI